MEEITSTATDSGDDGDGGDDIGIVLMCRKSFKYSAWLRYNLAIYNRHDASHSLRATAEGFTG